MIPDPTSVKSIKKTVSLYYKRFEEYKNNDCIFVFCDKSETKYVITRRLCANFPRTGLYFIREKKRLIKEEIINCLGQSLSENIWFIFKKNLTLLEKKVFGDINLIDDYKKFFQDSLKKEIVPYLYINIPGRFLKDLLSAFNDSFLNLFLVIKQQIEFFDLNDLWHKSIKTFKYNTDELSKNFFDNEIETVFSFIPNPPSDITKEEIRWDIIIRVWEYSLEYHWLVSLEKKITALSKKKYIDEGLLQNVLEKIAKAEKGVKDTNLNVFHLVYEFNQENIITLWNFPDNSKRKKVLHRAFGNHIPSILSQAYEVGPDNDYPKTKTNSIPPTEYPSWKIIWSRGLNDLNRLSQELVENKLLVDDDRFKQLFLCKKFEATEKDLDDDIPNVKVRTVKPVVIVLAILFEKGYINANSESVMKKTLSISLIDAKGKKAQLQSIRQYFTEYKHKGYSKVKSDKNDIAIKKILEAFNITVE